MAVITGITGAVTSWAGSGFNGSLLTGSRPAQFSLSMAMDDLETTAFADSGVGTHIRGLSSWSGSFTAQLAAPSNGSLGSVAGTGLYVTNINAWTLEAQQMAHESTAFAATTKAFIPGMISWGGTYAGYVDGTTVLVAAGLPSSNATATFTYQEQGGTDNTLSGEIFTTQLSANVAPNAANTVSYSYRGTGSLTQSTPSAGTPIFTAGAVPVATAATSLVLTASTGRTYTGSAFWTSISLSVAVNQATILTVGFQGSGALTIG